MGKSDVFFAKKKTRNILNRTKKSCVYILPLNAYYLQRKITKISQFRIHLFFLYGSDDPNQTNTDSKQWITVAMQTIPNDSTLLSVFIGEKSAKLSVVKIS